MPIRDIRLYGDPALATHRDDENIFAVFESKVNMLNNLRSSDRHELKGMFQNRKTGRLGVLKREFASTRHDDKPAIILIKGRKEERYNPESFGCYNLFDGIFEHGYRFEVIEGNITNDLEQNHPIVDICDAYSYYILETRPFIEKLHTTQEKFTVIW